MDNFSFYFINILINVKHRGGCIGGAVAQSHTPFRPDYENNSQGLFFCLFVLKSPDQIWIPLPPFPSVLSSTSLPISSPPNLYHCCHCAHCLHWEGTEWETKEETCHWAQGERGGGREILTFKKSLASPEWSACLGASGESWEQAMQPPLQCWSLLLPLS